MIYSKRIKATMCIAATITAFLTVDFNMVDAVSLTTEKGIAGIAVTFDKYYSASNVASTLSTASTLALQETNTDSIEPIKEEVDSSIDTSVEPATLSESIDNGEAVKEAIQEKQVSEYANVGISIANEYVNVRKEANTESEILGKLYRGSAATLLETEGEWVKIKSGKVTGYINAEFLAIGFDAEELVNKYGTKFATIIDAETLKVRKNQSIDSDCLTLVPGGEEYEVIKEYDEWVEIAFDEEEEESETRMTGFISKEYASISVEFPKAISVEEEQAKLAQEEAARQAEIEQQARLIQQEVEKTKKADTVKESSKKTTNKSSTKKSTSSSSEPVTTTVQVQGSGNGSELSNYALKFVGNPYVYGGTSLTNGADCSGFVQAVYKSFGYSIPRDSRSQAARAGSKVSAVSSRQAGDLIFYTGSSGNVNHVAIYIGGDKVVHASNPRTGIKVSSYNYREPYMVRRVAN